MNLCNAFRLLGGCLTTILLAAPLQRSSATVAWPLVWRWSNPTPHGANITEMAYANGFTIQVAERGQIFTSQDGVSWIPQDSHTTAALRGVTFLGGRILITGQSGTVLFADDPAVFYAANVNTSDWLESVTASPSL
ncbi:MAG TPA: hypothetical protein VNZ22_00765, partial [Bacillota bacterium]|nr:hypothetical protein [Bacillota bacterium]